MRLPFLSKIRYRLLAKIFFLITIVITLMVVVLSNLLYNEFRSEGLLMTYRNNQQVLEQLSFNIETMNESIKNFMLTLFQDSDNRVLMYNKNSDKDDNNFIIQRTINRFQKTLASNSMISSAAIYNRSRNMFYTTFGWRSQDTNMEWNRILYGNSNVDTNIVPPLTPIPTLLNEGALEEEREVFTYVLYDTQSDSSSQIEGALIVNIKTDWLRNNLIKYGGGLKRIYILDNQNRVILDSSREHAMFTPFSSPYLASFEKKTGNGKSFIYSNKVITYFTIKGTDWLMVTEAPYATEFAPLKHMREKTLMYTLSCLIAGLLLAFYVAQKIYAPFGNLVNKVRENLVDRLPEAANHKETELLASALEYSMRTIGDYDNYKISTKDLLQENKLKSLLIGDKLINSIPWEEEGSDREPYLLVVFKPDQELRYHELKEEEKRLLYFSVSNIADDVLGALGPFQKAAMSEGAFVYVLERSESEPLLNEHTYFEQIRHVQSYIKRIIPGITLSAGVGSIPDHAYSLHQVYKHTNSLFDFRIFFGMGCLLRQDMVQDRLHRTDLDVPMERIEKLIDAMKSGNQTGMEELFENIFEWVSQGDSNQLFGLLTRLVFLIYREIQEMNAHLVDPIVLNVNSFTNEIMHQLTLEDIREQFINLFVYIIDKTKVQTAMKHNFLVNAIVEYIHMDFYNENLSLKKIASEFKMSAKYVGLIFRETMNVSVADYVHQLRLDKVSEKLRSSDDSIKDILEKVGYTNETNFYKLFKKHYGITPNEYRQNLALMRKET